jgi:hypothetical protein
MLFLFALIVVAAVAWSCFTPATITTHGIPNFAPVRPGLWRGGQPTTPEGWAYLASLGVRHVVKLNMDGEGTDYAAQACGIQLHYLAIEPEGDQDVFDNLFNTFRRPDRDRVLEALRVMREEDGVFVHCLHGQDRTGFVVGWFRVEQGWTKAQAYAEMRARGFHPALHGLMEAWEEWVR